MSQRRLFVALSVAVLSIIALSALLSAGEAQVASAVTGPIEIKSSQVSASSPSPSAPVASSRMSQPIEIENISSMTPGKLYLGLERQTMTPAQFQVAPHRENNLWIQAKDGWLQYVVVPIGVTLNLIAVSPEGGMGRITEKSLPDGLNYSFEYDFYPNSQIPYHAAEIGKHQISFSIGGQESNTVIIHVVDSDYYRGYHLSLNPVEPEYESPA